MIRNYSINPLTKRKLKKLEISEVETLLDIVHQATILIDGRDGTIVCANAAMTELSAFTRDELSNMCFDDLLAENNHHNIIRDLLKSVDRTREFELSMIMRGGGTIDINASSVALDHDSEKFVITFEPASITEQRKIEKDRQRQLWDGLQTLAVSLLETGIEDALILALEACFVLTGSSAVGIYQASGDKPALKRTYNIGANHLLPEETLAKDLAALQKPTLWSPGRRSETNLHRHARATKVSYLASAPIGQVNASVGLIAAAGHHSEPMDEILEVLSFVGSLITSIVQQHTLLAHLQNTIKEHNSTLKEHELITGFIQDGIVILRNNLSVRDMNKFAEETLGYTSSEVQGQSIDKILISSDNIKTQIEEALSKDTHSQIDNIRLYRRNGQAFLANIRILPMVEIGELSGVIIIFRDLSEQEEYHTLNQQLEQRAMLGEVTASFAHEVRNPINNISTGLQLLAVSLPEDDINQEHVKRIKGDCDRLAELIKSSLTIVRPIDFKMKHVDIGSLIKFIIDRLQARLVRANIQHNIQVEKNVPPVFGDFNALEHVFQNLIENAMQAMNLNGGTLSIKIRHFQREGESNYVEINISDTGVGIPAEISERIFEPFFTTKTNGTGLGLAIVKRIITAHKGVINMESIPGATVFQVRLPVAKTA